MDGDRAKDRSREEADRATNRCNRIGNTEEEHCAQRVVPTHGDVRGDERRLPSEEHCRAQTDHAQADHESGVLGIHFDPLGEQPRNGANDEEDEEEACRYHRTHLEGSGERSTIAR